jgi:hypothetical protein
LDPFCDYYLCIKDGETELVGAFLPDEDAFLGYDSVQRLAYWQALQWVVALGELERSPVDGFDLVSLTAFLQAAEEVDPRVRSHKNTSGQRRPT